MANSNHQNEDAGFPGADQADSILGFLSFLLAQAVTLNEKKGQYWTREFGFNLSEWRVLALVACMAEPNVQAIRQKLYLDKGLMSRITKRLIDEGYLLVSQSSANHRVKALSLTPQGKDLYHRMFAVAREKNELSAQLLEGPEADELKRLLAKYERRLREAVDQLDQELTRDDVL
ncbi:MarR family winged helix-turn-helix transcriptional regulator [Alphaproteobacteria bacterium]|nr:MarR family winged helix-turn-helix transcriptional regulator [Alphaproteobacteria bacterium]